MAVPTADGVSEGARGVIERLWAGRPGPVGRVVGALLTPPELAFRGIVAARAVAYRTGLFRSHPAPVPAISVGNLTVGGTGKTPLVRWLVARLTDRGHVPGILHGGYAGDEPALLRRWFPDLPVVADRDRVRGAETAVARGADVLVLDDGFQHRRIQRALDVVLLAAEGWTPHPRLLPRGRYREPLRALDRSDVVVITRRDAGPDVAADVARSLHERTGRTATAVAYLGPGEWLSPSGAPQAGGPHGEAIAVAGIGRPGAFFRQVAETGVELAGTMAFPDHHAYGARDAERIRRRSGDGPVITTAKDAIKLGPLLADAELWVMDQTVTFEEGGDVLVEALNGVVL